MKDIQCKKCTHFTPEWCEFKRDSLDPDLMRDCEYYKVKTNANRIRVMTDEELAEFLNCHNFCARNFDCENGKQPCIECNLEWLKQEADE